MAEYLLSLKDRRQVAEGTTAFWFDTTGTDFSFAAGQNADYVLDNPPYTDAEGNKRTFSFASSPQHRGWFMIATRMRPTAFKNSLKEVPLGTKVKVVGPLGNMVLHDDATKPAVMIAGGIGITPFRSMIEDATMRKLPHQVLLLYSNRTAAVTAFRDDLEQWAKQNMNLKAVFTITDTDDPAWPYERGMVDEVFIKKQVPDLTKSVFYIAGPDAMTLAMRKMLLELGVSKDNIKLEAFSGY
ncbi:MAG: FAD-dependent oxidoreductase [Candidatus Kerfeldbacteria bacterium]|nr:FAD-dependent oxidoreductase [Candidatus Kerfeldbacteria bacterium]